MFLLYSLQLVINIHVFHGVRESSRLGMLKVLKSVPQRWLRHLGLSILHVNHGLLMV
jgi:hypothetical protein